ncbi:MAG TPA: transglutaminase domain-containing protein [Candidatus Dormibacteraeota bacterium]
MQSASPSFPTRVIQRTREALPGGVLWTSLLVFFLTLAVSKSTVTADWVPGVEVVPLVALVGAIVMGLLALTPIPWGAGVAIGMMLAPVAAGVAAWPVLHANHPSDALGLSLLQVWWARLQDGTNGAIADSAFDLFLINWLMWITGGWLSWCVLRWRRPMLGLVPGATAFATNLLNFPRDQNGYVLTILILTLALLLWTNYTGSIASAMRARVKLTGDARWDFWESGLVAMAALIVVAIMLPPLSTEDRSVDMESSAFTSWAQLLQSLSHPGQAGNAAGTGAGTTGFSADVLLNPSLKRTHAIVFTYTVQGTYADPYYFRGVNDTFLFEGAWRYAQLGQYHEAIPKSAVPKYAEDYAKMDVAAFKLSMIAPPNGNSDILFYPGRLYHVNRDSLATESLVVPATASGALMNIDRLTSVTPHTSRGSYGVTVEYSAATTADLQAAGDSFPDWANAYTDLPKNYRAPDVLDRIHKKAVEIVQAAGAQNEYDSAVAIETYLRSNVFTYTLDPPQAPPGVDPLDYFLFTSHAGYCEFFATAMGDMLRSLGIPTRLVNGFGPGTYEPTVSGYVVRSEDAHTWVESYFPNYGWIQFEPTRDTSGVYNPIPRGGGGLNTCQRDLGCDTPGGGSTGGVLPVQAGKGASGGDVPGSSGGGGLAFRIPDPGTLTKIVAIVVALLLFAFAAAARYLRPRTVMGVWRRTLVLARLAGADRRVGETPFELGRRLARSFPEASEPMRSLASGFVVAAYAPADVAGSARVSVMEAWSALRPLLLRRVIARLRPARV